MNSMRNGSRRAGREQIDDAAADAELAVLVDRILAGEAGVDQQLSEVVRRDLQSGPRLERRIQQPLRAG